MELRALTALVGAIRTRIGRAIPTLSGIMGPVLNKCYILPTMAKAARAIIVEGDRILVMYRNKYGSQYFTLVGGKVAGDETTEQALVREVKEETGLDITDARLVFIENHLEPYNEQYIYVCNVAPHEEVAIQETAEEAQMNGMDINVHKPQWVSVASFDRLPFRTPRLHIAIIDGLRKGFPAQAVTLSNTSSAAHTKSRRIGLLDTSRKLVAKIRTKRN
jgi:8-oxo-dGTP pyrophosphatase MutT (NUDIX family)